MENRCIPLYPVKDVILPPKAEIPILITGQLPLTFSSGFAVVHVLPVTNTYSVVTTETEFINQTTCFNLTNTINKSRYRSGMVNSNTVNSKFHLIQSLLEILATILSFHV